MDINDLRERLVRLTDSDSMLYQRKVYEPILLSALEKARTRTAGKVPEDTSLFGALATEYALIGMNERKIEDARKWLEIAVSRKTAENNIAKYSEAIDSDKIVCVFLEKDVDDFISKRCGKE